MIKYAALSEARAIVTEWNGLPRTVAHISNSGNSVFRFKKAENGWQILRLTDATFRSREEVKAELEFLRHLKEQSVAVAYGIPNNQGLLTSEVVSHSGVFIASVLSYAEGIRVETDSPDWNRRFFRAWGKSLAAIHTASQTYTPSATTPIPWIWHDEILFRQAEQLLPQDDSASRQEYQEVLRSCHCLGQSSEFGVIHADYTPQNFHYSPITNRIVAFDFGNCCYHWFAADIAIALSALRQHRHREVIKAEILAGYSEVKALPANCAELIPIFLRLRAIYVYLDRLYLFGLHPTIEQSRTLNQLKLRVHAQASW